MLVSALRQRWVYPAVLAALVFLAFAPVLRDGFVSYDDPEYVTANPHVNTGLSWENTVWAFTSAHSSNWHPLTWISHQFDCTLFGLKPAGHHFTSLLLHVINTLLLFLWLSGATGRAGPSAFVALVFGLHPLHVESVAWVAERKDVLSTMFGLLALLAYTAYARNPGIARYFVVVALFAASLLSKPMLITLPLLLLLIDWWPLGRTGLRRLILEKLPLLALSGLSAAATVWAQRQGGSVVAIEQLPLGLRLGNAAVSYLRYLEKTVWPVKLAVFYPFPLHGIAAWKVAGSLALLAIVTAAVFILRKRSPWLTAGWCWYVVALAPVIGVVQVGMQCMADRYMYVPVIGLLFAIAWECAHVKLHPAAAVPFLLVCALLSWRQAQVWRDGLTLFTHAVKVTEDNFVAHDNLGVELDRQGRAEEALAQYREALRIRQGDRNGEQNYAQATFAKAERLFAQGKTNEALPLFREGLRYRPRNAAARIYAGIILTGQNQLAPAIAEFQQAIQIDPSQAKAYSGLGVALARAGQPVAALQAFTDCIRHGGASVEAYFDLGLVQAALGKSQEALASFDAALQLQPDFRPAREAREAVARGAQK
jgi:protein O-mannosyl-transferase